LDGAGPGGDIPAAGVRNEICAKVNMADPKSLAVVARRVLLSLAVACALVLATGTGALAADLPKANTAKSKPMNMDEPMAGEMKKESMKKGDVKKAAEKKDREMRKMLEHERQSAGTVKK
jgi:pentapeptide MXKDX repeat protein